MSVTNEELWAIKKYRFAVAERLKKLKEKIPELGLALNLVEVELELEYIQFCKGFDKMSEEMAKYFGQG